MRALMDELTRLQVEAALLASAIAHELERYGPPLAAARRYALGA